MDEPPAETKRHRHAQYREHTHDHADVDHGLAHDPNGDAHQHHGNITIGDLQCDDDHAPGENREDSNTMATTDESGLLADDRENEIVMGGRR